MKSNHKFHRALVKRYAKEAKRESGLPLTVFHEQFARAVGYESWHDLVERCKAMPSPSDVTADKTSSSTLSEILAAKPLSRIPFRFRVGRVTWAVQASTYGPILSAEAGAPACLRTVSLGLYPVIVQESSQPGKTSFCMTRYGNERIFDLGFYGSQEVFELGRLAGIPIWPRTTGWNRARKQRTESQLAFLGSPAFAAIRHWMRTAGHELIKPGDWISGLPSMIWTTLVAMSDENFAFHADAVAKVMFEKRMCTLDEREEIWDAMCAQWHFLRPDGTQLSVPIEKLVTPALQRQLAKA